MSKHGHGEHSRISEHDRAVRGYREYAAWRDLAEWLDKNPPVPIILRNILEGQQKLSLGEKLQKRMAVALEVLIRDRYPTFAVLERMKGKGGENERPS